MGNSIYAMEKELFGGQPYLRWSKSQIGEQLRRKRTTAINLMAINKSNRVMGYILYDKKVKEISAIGVKKKYSGKGVGSKLMRSILRRTKGENMTLQVARENEPAQRFYKRFGFRKT